MKIIDQRKGEYSQLPAVEVLNKLINAASAVYFNGIKKIVFLDTDYKNEGAIGRKFRKKGSLLTEIEIMFDAFDEYPKDMLQCEITTAFVLGQILFHEIYHHLRHRNKLRALKYKKEEKEANYWALKETIQILNKLYNKDDLLIFKEKYYRLIGSGRISPPF